MVTDTPFGKLPRSSSSVTCTEAGASSVQAVTKSKQPDNDAVMTTMGATQAMVSFNMVGLALALVPLKGPCQALGRPDLAASARQPSVSHGPSIPTPQVTAPLPRRAASTARPPPAPRHPTPPRP